MQDYTKLVRRAYEYHGEAIRRARDEHGFTLDTDHPPTASRAWRETICRPLPAFRRPP